MLIATAQLLYIYILGWNVDFGHLEAVNLISANKYSEKQIGYLAVTLFLHEKHELLHLVVNSIRKDLLGHNELFNCLALHAIANVGGREMGEALSGDVHRLLISPYVRSLATHDMAPELTKHACLQNIKGLCQEEGSPHSAAAVQKTPRHCAAAMGRAHHLPDGRHRPRRRPVRHVPGHGSGSGQPGTVQGRLCKGGRTVKASSRRRGVQSRLSILQGPVPLDSSQAPEASPVFPSLRYVTCIPRPAIVLGHTPTA